MILKSFHELADHLAVSDDPLAEDVGRQRDWATVNGAGKKSEKKARKDAAWRRIIDRSKRERSGA